MPFNFAAYFQPETDLDDMIKEQKWAIWSMSSQATVWQLKEFNWLKLC